MSKAYKDIKASWNNPNAGGKLSKRYSDISAKDANYGVDDAYVKSFISGTQNFFNRAGSADVNFGNASDTYKSYQDSYADLSSRANNIRGYYNANKDTLDPDSYKQMISYLDDFQRNSSQALKYFRNTSDYYSQFSSEDEYKKSLMSGKEIYADNLAKITAIDEELKEIKSQNKLGNYSKDQRQRIKELQSQKDALVSENNQYSRTQKVMDDYGNLTSNSDFESVSANRNYNNPTMEQIRQADMDAYNFDAQSDNISYYDSTTNEYVLKDGSRVTRPETLEVHDKLGAFLNASADDVTRAYNDLLANNGTDTWGKLIQEGDNGSWNQLTDKEIEIYYYLLANNKADADKYLEDMKVELNRRATINAQDYLSKTYDEANALERIALNLASVPANVYGGTFGFAEDVYNTVTGKGINPYSNAHGISTFAQQIRSKTSENIDNSVVGGKIPWINFGFSDAYQAVMSGLDSFAGAKGLGKAYTVAMGMSAGSSKAKELYEKGASNGQVFWGALGSGVAEAAFEYISLDHFLKTTSTKSKMAILKQAFAQAGIEASEEMFTEIANAIIDTANMRGLSEWNQMLEANEGNTLKTFFDEVGNVVSAGIAGAISGGLMAGLGSTANYIGYNQMSGQLGRNVYRNGDINTLVDYGKNNDIGKNGQNLLSSAESSLAKENLSNRDFRNLGKYADAISDNTNENSIKAEIKDRLLAENKGVSDDVIDQVYKYMTSDADIKLASAQVKSIAKQMQNADNFNTSVALRNLISNAEILSGNSNRSNEQQYMEKVSETGKTVDAKTKKAVTIQGIATDTKGNTVLKTDKGLVNREDVKYKNASEAYAYETVLSLGASVEVGNYILQASKVSDMNSKVFLNESALAYRYGLTNQESRLESLSIPDEVKDRLFQEGRKDASKLNAKKMADMANKKGIKKTSNKAKLVSTVEEKLKNGTLNDNQIATIEAANTLASISNLDITLFDSTKDKGKVMIDLEDGTAKFESDANGWYKVGTNKIYIDINAGADFQGIGLLTLGHETGHFIREWNAEAWQTMADSIVEEINRQAEEGKSATFERMLAVKFKKYKELRRNGHKDYQMSDSELHDAAYEDVICDSLASIMKDTETFKDLTDEIKGKDEDLWNKIKDFIESMLDKLNKAIAKFTGNAEDYAGQTVENATVEFRNNLRKLYVKAFAGANENIGKAMSKEAEIMAQAGIQFDEQTGTVYSERFSTGTYNESNVDRDTLVSAIAKECGISEKEADDFIRAEESASLSIVGTFLDFEGNDKEVAIKSNSDYPQGTIDLTNICTKRVPVTNLTNRLQESLPEDLFTADDYADIRLILMNDGRIVACGLCFVEDRRQYLGEIAQDFINEWKKALKNGGNLKRINNEGKVKDVRIGEELAKRYGVKPGLVMPSQVTFRQEMFASSNNWFKLQKSRPDVAAAFEAFNNARGQSAGRLLLDRAEYKREILKWTPEKVKAVNDVGGLRIFSFSDFEVVHLVDLLQIIEDCAAMGVKIQGYTKQTKFAKLVSKTGIKLNRSFIPYGATGIKTVNGVKVLAIDTVEGINNEDADFLDEIDNPNVGNNITGINDEQIHLAMKDNFFHYIIPFHTNKKSSTNEKLGVAKWRNYKAYQTDKTVKSAEDIKTVFSLVAKYKAEGISDSDAYDKALNETGIKFSALKEDKMINIYTDVLSDPSVVNEKTFVDKYLAVCKERNIVPRYAQFLNITKDGEFKYAEGYSKFLVDFKLFDYATGEILPQGLVTPAFDSEYINKLIADEGKKTERERSGADYPEELYQDILNYIKVKHGYRGNKASYNKYKAIVDETVVKANRDEDGTRGMSVSPSANKYSERKQEYDSKNTSVKQVPATFSVIGLNANDRVLDWGGGQYDIAKNAIEDFYKGITFEVVDKFNRTESHNNRILSEFAEDKADVLTINNVLNVIKEDDVIVNDVLAESKKYLKDGGICYIKVYEKAGNGIGEATSNGYQRNQKAKDYLPLIRQVYKYAEVYKGDLIYASDKPISKSDIPKASSGAKEAFTAATLEGRKNATSLRDVKYSTRRNLVGEDGKVYPIVVELNEKDFRKATKSGKDFAKYLYEHFLNQKFVVYDADGNEEVIEFAGQNERVKKDGADNGHPVWGEFTQEKDYINKKVIINLPEVVANSDQTDFNPNGNHQWLDQNGFEIRTCYVIQRNKNIIMPIKLSIGKAKDGRNILYSAKRQKNEGVAIDINATSEFAKKQKETAVKITTSSFGKTIPYDNPFVNKNSERNKSYAPTFYSKMSNVIDGIKTEKVGANGVIPYLKGKGVKDEEIKWSGIATFLEGKKSLTKAELQEFAKNSMLQIEEKTLTDEKGKSLKGFYDAISEYYEFDEDDFEYFFDYDGSLVPDLFTDRIDQLLEEEQIDDTDYYNLSELAKDFSNGKMGETKWSKYVTDGTTNYREILFKMPGSDYTNSAMDTHWGEEGVLAHARIDDLKLPDGSKMLFVEEIQSDWHNAGQKYGYDKKKHTFEVKHEAGTLRLYVDGHKTYNFVYDDGYEIEDEKGRPIGKYDEEKALEYLKKSWSPGILKEAPDAPFANGKYIEFVMKRLLRMAAEEGYDSIGWTTGKMQEDRWSDEYAEGYRIEYDQDIPSFMKKYGKQWGAEVRKTQIDNGDWFEEKLTDVWAVALTPEMKNSVLNEGQTLYSERILMGSMFSGGGTLESGLVYQMLDKEFAVEFNKQIASVYMDNHGSEHMFVGDVRDFDSKKKQNVFYLHASPVCKNFSKASNTGGETTLDITTAKATARVLEEQMPEVFTVENVKQYIGSEAYNIIAKKLDELGYKWDVDVYKAADYGNATKRERMVIRAVKTGTLPDKPQKMAHTNWGDATRDLWETELIPSHLAPATIDAIRNTPELKNLELLKQDKAILIYGTSKGHQAVYAWEDGLAPTLTTKCGDARIIMDGKVYEPTPKFMGRLQGLPDDYKYPKAKTTAFKIIGNGISTQLTKAVMGGVLDSAYEQTHEGKKLYSERVKNSSFNELYTVLEDGRIKPNNVKDLSTEDWKIIYKAVNKLGYGMESVKDAKEVYSSYVGESGFNKEQSEEIMKAYGISESNPKAQNLERVKKAKKIYGTTTDFREAGYLLPDGYMLDFSGKKDGGEAHVRYMDHREISSAFDKGELDVPYYEQTAYMNAFIAEGNIRLMDSQGVTIGEIEPTQKQYEVLEKFISHVLKTEKYFYLDLSNDDGYTVSSRDYGANDKPSKIINDIKTYFKNGELPYRSNLQQFLYSERNLGYHAGDLGKAEPYSSQGGSRGTGHFGTGTYFVGNEAEISDDYYGKRPHEEVDFGKYNLFKPKNYTEGKKLHEFLKGMDGYDRMAEDAIKSESEWEEVFYDTEASIYDDDDYGIDLHAKENLHNLVRLYGKYNVADAIAHVTDWEYAPTSNGTLWSDEANESVPVESVYDKVNLSDVLSEIEKKHPRKWDYSLSADDYGEWINSFAEIADVLGITENEVEKAVNKTKKQLKDVNYYGANANVSDSAATVFMKALGYEGVDVRHIKEMDNTTYGSVIYDLKGEDLARKNEIGTARFSERNTSLSTRTLLSNALMETAQNDVEKKYIEDYQANIEKIDAEQSKLAEIKAEMKDLMFTKGKRDNARLKALQEEATKISNRINVYDKKLLKLESTKPLQAVLEREKTKARKRAEQKAREALDDYRSRGQNTVVRNKIKKLVDELKSETFNPKVNHYVPADLMKPVNEILSAINLDSGRSQKLSTKLAELKVRYDAMASDPKYASGYDKSVSDMVQTLIGEVGDVSIYDMNTDQLEKTYTTLKAIAHMIKTAHKVRNIESEKLSYEISAEMNRETKAVKHESANIFDRWIDFSLRPETAFERFAGFKKDSMWSKVYQMLNQGQLKKMQIEMESNEIFKDVFADEKYVRSLSDTKNLVDIGLKDDDGNTVMITRGMALAIYRALMNEDNTRHMMVGGITVPDIKKYYNGSDDAYGVGHIVVHGVASKGLSENSYKLADARKRRTQAKKEGKLELVKEIEEEINSLNAERSEMIADGEALMDLYRDNIKNIITDKDIAFLNATAKFFDEYSKKVLNETTMELYGFEKAQVENYLPIHTDPNFRQATFEQITKDMNLENVGFMKDRVNASNPIMLEDLAEIINRQIDKVSTYSGLTIAVKDFGKIYGKSDAGFSSSLQDTIASKFGKPGQKYIDNLLSDIVGSRRTESTFFDRARGFMAGATLSINPRVALAQAASLPTAASEIGWKSVMKASGKMFTKHDLDLIAKYSPLLYNRSKGTDIEVADIKAMSQVQNRVMRKLNWLMGWIEAIDKKTVGTLWYASQYYVQDNFKDLTVGSDEYYKKVAEVFNGVVERTQPNYTTLQRPDILRNPNAVVKQLTMFMTQRLQNFNIVYESGSRLAKYNADRKAGINGVTDEDVKNAKADLTNAVTSQVVAASMIVGIKFLVDALMHSMNGYRDDDKELTGKSISLSLLENLLESFAGNLLGGGELFTAIDSIVTGDRYYGISLSGVDVYADALQNFISLTQNPSLDQCNELAKAICTMFGIPLNNVEKIGIGIYYQFKDIVNGDFGSFEAGVERTNKQDISRAYSAYKKGDTAKVKEVVKALKDEYIGKDKTEKEAVAQIRSSMTSFLKSDFLDAYKKNDTAKMAEIRRFMQTTGVYDNVVATTQDWIKNSKK